jgi:hypothetical protein
MGSWLAKLSIKELGPAYVFTLPNISLEQILTYHTCRYPFPKQTYGA